MVDFTHVVDFIFKRKDEYYKLTDKDKSDLFFIINRKFARRYPKHAQLVNDPNIDKASALDMWFYYFEKIRVIDIPKWYWYKQKKQENKLPYTKEEQKQFMRYFEIGIFDLMFLHTYFGEELEHQMKFMRKLTK